MRGAGEDGDSPSCLRVEWREEEGRAGDWRTQASDSVSRKVEGGTRLNTVRGAVSEGEGWNMRDCRLAALQGTLRGGRGG